MSKSIEEIYNNIESNRISKLEKERNIERLIYEQQQKQKREYLLER